MYSRVRNVRRAYNRCYDRPYRYRLISYDIKKSRRTQTVSPGRAEKENPQSGWPIARRNHSEHPLLYSRCFFSSLTSPPSLTLLFFAHAIAVSIGRMARFGKTCELTARCLYRGSGKLKATLRETGRDTRSQFSTLLLLLLLILRLSPSSYCCCSCPKGIGRRAVTFISVT